MNRISIDQADERVKAFLQRLAVPGEGAVLELAGQPLLQVFPADASDDHLRRALRERGRQLVERARGRNQGVSAQQLEEEVREAIEQVRQRNGV